MNYTVPMMCVNISELGSKSKPIAEWYGQLKASVLPCPDIVTEAAYDKRNFHTGRGGGKVLNMFLFRKH